MFLPEKFYYRNLDQINRKILKILDDKSESMKHKLKKIVLLGGDLALFYFALFLGLWLRYLEVPDADLLQKHLTPFSLLLLVWLVVFYISGHYNLNTTEEKKLLRKGMTSFFAAFLISIIYFYAVPVSEISPKTNLAFFTIVYFCLFFLWRRFYYWALRSYLPRQKLALIGLNSQVKNLIKEIRSQPHAGFDVSFILDPENKEKNWQNIPIFKNLEELKNLIRKKKINTIILPNDIHDSQTLRSVLFSCLPLKINFQSLSDFSEYLTGKVPVEVISQMWFLENLSEGKKNLYDKFKRFYDLILSFFLLVISLPFYPFIALAIKLDNKGPVFFKQIRAGQGGAPFTMIKFRTMKVENNDHSLTKEKDDRITRVGRFLRNTRLDEPPQLLNIIKGEMSFIGPRPERPEFIEQLEKSIPFYRERMLIKPGLTGWDQISGEYHSPTAEDTLEKLQYDLFYIKNLSLYLDLSIILKTITTVLSKGGR